MGRVVWGLWHYKIGVGGVGNDSDLLKGCDGSWVLWEESGRREEGERRKGIYK